MKRSLALTVALLILCLLGYTISPDNVWVLETGREYVIQVHIFDKNNHKIYPTEVRRTPSVGG